MSNGYSFPPVRDMSYQITESVAEVLSYHIIRICQAYCHPIESVTWVHLFLSVIEYRGVLPPSHTLSYTPVSSHRWLSVCLS